MRLRTLPISPVTILAGKVIVYMGVCLVQFLFLLFVGAQVLPRRGTASLEVGTQYAAIAAGVRQPVPFVARPSPAVPGRSLKSGGIAMIPGRYDQSATADK